MPVYRHAYLRAADGQSDMDMGQITVRVHRGGSEEATAATLAVLRREEATAGVDFSGMTLEWQGADGRRHEQVLSRPAHRPRRDPGAARVNLVVRVHPDTRLRLAAEAQRTGESQGQVIDRLVQSLDHG